MGGSDEIEIFGVSYDYHTVIGVCLKKTKHRLQQRDISVKVMTFVTYVKLPEFGRILMLYCLS